MAARLFYHAKKVYPDGCVLEIVIWQLPQISPERPHALKYRMHYGRVDGTCIVRYDNEIGKGDHRHIGKREEPYPFTDIETLLNDFFDDVAKARGGTHG
jgi:hypothetical protein